MKVTRQVWGTAVAVLLLFVTSTLCSATTRRVGQPNTVTVTASTGETCGAALSSGTGSCALTFTASGSPKLTAACSGDTNFKSSTSAKVTQTVQP
jgi:hypothetical protein